MEAASLYVCNGFTDLRILGKEKKESEGKMRPFGKQKHVEKKIEAELERKSQGGGTN